MKKILFISIFLTIVFSINAQKNNWTTTNPFQTDVFVENFGQFDSWAKTTEPIKYAINNSDKIFFTPHGLVYKLDKVTRLSKEERKEIKQNTGVEEPKVKVETYFVNMTWEGSNPNATIEVTEQGQGYYTFGEKDYESIKAKGYRKLTYKNLYPNIDVEYIIPAKGGIKYSIILHAGADPEKVKMLYTGDVEKISTDNEGNIIIATPAGNITDHAPKSFYKETKESIASSLNLNNNTVSFNLVIRNSSFVIVVDPWTTTPTSLVTSNIAYDVASDNFGNVYVSGGTTPYKLAKYSTNGNFLWSFTNPSGWYAGYYSKFCILPNSGTVFIGESYNSNAPRVMKISSNGIYAFTSPYFIGNREIWIMFYNSCSGQLIGFGGGTVNPNNLQLISDTNLTSNSAVNFNGGIGGFNDISSVVMDNNGDFYVLMPIPLYNMNVNNSNKIFKSLISNNYNPPCAFSITTGYNFFELTNTGLGIQTVRANALALNSSYLFSYDGRTLKAWNKTNGTLLDSAIVNTAYCNYQGQNYIAAGRYRTHEGIAVDECNNIWVGGHDTVHVYSFNGTTFTAGTPITTNITGEVYDINYNGGLNLLSVCGNGFLTTLNVAPCGVGLTITNTTIPNCTNGTASITVNGGNPPYTYLWSNGATTNSITASPGTYYVTITDNSCNLNALIDTINIINTPSIISSLVTNSGICFGQSSIIGVTGGILGTGANWNWYTNSCGGTYVNSGSTLIINPTTTTMYYIRAEGTCNTTTCVSLTVLLGTSILSASATSMLLDICSGDSTVLNINGGNLCITDNWYWYSGSCGGVFIGTGSTITQYPTSSTIYYVRAEGTSNTTSCVSVFVSMMGNSTKPNSITGIPTTINQGNSTSLSQTGGVLGDAANWYWYTDSCGGNLVGNGNTLTLSPSITTTYWVRAEGFCNTTTCVSITITVFPLKITITSVEPKDDISFYPNPTSSDFTLKLNESNATLKI